MLNVDELLLKWATTTPSSLAFVDEDREVTFAELNLDVRKVATALAQAGISRGDIVVIALPPYLGWNCALALQLLGATILPRSIETSFPDEISPDWHIALTVDTNFSNTPLILFDNALLDKIKQAAPIASAPGYANQSDVNFLFSTSGTTGLKKYVAMSSIDLSSQVDQIWPSDLYSKDEILTLPLFGGWWATAQAYKRLAVGKAFLNCGVVDQRLLNLLHKNSVRTLSGSPSQISALMDLMQKTGIQLPEIETFILGGNIPTQTFIDRIREKFSARIFDAYGSTEGGAIATRELTKSTPKGGEIFSEVEVEIIDENEAVVPVGTAGQIRYRRTVMAKEYHLNPRATSEFFKDGYFYPGDLGYIDEFGHLVISGRISEIINLGGVKISPDFIDAAAITQPGVKDCAAFAFVAEDGVEKLAVAVVVDGNFKPEDFKKNIWDQTRANPAIILEVQQIPRNPTGKVLRDQLSKMQSQS
ncbi:MAG: AMP-binding protein [Actinobacteria bacterium]|uniref:Unannotated protein n=1 Tax=freshwater metagenome TaxID=449393 RepID=A0A6J7W590_9ZZZZ|nr:AMP-binding protein [Actinomycetota bacterium]MSX71956.1 AMP-binding protein [Actinomycetota bacterium]MSY69385.1 AMP-binding protein [Actinomycetota bacterium]MTA75947.1 AMP-binding protein [Actinomycetota bacterium]